MQVHFDIVFCLKRVLNMFLKKCEADAQTKASQRAKNQIISNARTNTGLRNLRGLHNADAGLVELGRNSSFIHLAQQTFIELFIELDVALQNAVLKKLLRSSAHKFLL